MKDKSDLMSLFLKQGISSLSDMRRIYDGTQDTEQVYSGGDIKESKIRIAEGEAEALLKIKKAEADGIKLLKDAKADSSVLALKSYEALEKLASGQSTKIIVPSEMQNLATFGTVINEMIDKKNK